MPAHCQFILQYSSWSKDYQVTLSIHDHSTTIIVAKVMSKKSKVTISSTHSCTKQQICYISVSMIMYCVIPAVLVSIPSYVS